VPRLLAGLLALAWLLAWVLARLLARLEKGRQQDGKRWLEMVPTPM
jgi:hypothetical protein